MVGTVGKDRMSLEWNAFYWKIVHASAKEMPAEGMEDMES